MDKIYSDFAEVYDCLQDIDYDTFIDYYIKLFKKYNRTPNLILDLGCGTGNITIPMSKLGYDMIGLDISEEMLFIASEKAREDGLSDKILFLNQDMTEFELYGTVDSIICALDGINYLTEDDDLEKLFSLADNYLNPDGIFIFDINTTYKLKNILGGNTYVYDNDGAFCVWASEFSEDEMICDFYLDFFIKENSENNINNTDNNSDNDSGNNSENCCKQERYIRKSEVQSERAYSDSFIKQCAEKSGLNFVAAYDDRTFNQPHDKSERVFYVFEKKQKVN